MEGGNNDVLSVGKGGSKVNETESEFPQIPPEFQGFMLRSWDTRTMKSMILFFVGALVSIPAAYASSDPLHRSYRIEADFREFENRKIEAVIEMKVENRGTKPI